jgi:hypothetical protein
MTGSLGEFFITTSNWSTRISGLALPFARSSRSVYGATTSWGWAEPTLVFPEETCLESYSSILVGSGVRRVSAGRLAEVSAAIGKNLRSTTGAQRRNAQPVSHARAADKLVEAAGIEPASRFKRKERWRATSVDSCRQSVAMSRFRVPWRPPQSWRHVGDGADSRLPVPLSALQDYLEVARSRPTLPPPVAEACPSPSPRGLPTPPPRAHRRLPVARGALRALRPGLRGTLRSSRRPSRPTSPAAGSRGTSRGSVARTAGRSTCSRSLSPGGAGSTWRGGHRHVRRDSPKLTSAVGPPPRSV